MTAPLFLRPVFQERIWGGRQLATHYGYDIPDGPVGECWGISAHPNGPSTVVGGPHAGRSLLEVWQTAPEFFGQAPQAAPQEGATPFPLLVKLLAAADWLSVQVHPDDAQAAELEGQAHGKTECWYVIDAAPGAELVLGHTAATAAELTALIDGGRWDELLLRCPVAAGDFVHVPSGTLHAIGPGVLLCEVQQNSDTTYRVYDFDRTDAQGRPRELHLDKAKRVLTSPHDADATDTAQPAVDVPGGRRRPLLTSPFTVTLHTVTGPGYRDRFSGYQLCTVVAGGGTIAWQDEEHALKAGDHLVLPAAVGEVRIDGPVTLLVSAPS